MFDVDGTLANTEEAHRQAFNQQFAAVGLNWHWDKAEYKRLLKVSGGVERMKHYMRQNQLGVPAEDEDGFIKQLHREKTQSYNQLLQQGGIRLRPGIARLIQQAREQGIHLAITTTTTRVNVETLLRVNLGEAALSWFDCWVCGEDVQHKKPDPEVYLLALQQLSLQPEQCIALEDSANGVAAALAAQIPCLVTENDYTHGDDFSGALSVMENLGEPDKPGAHLSGLPLPTCVQIEDLRDWLAQAQRRTQASTQVPSMGHS